MKLNLLLVSIVNVALLSCNGQATSQTDKNSKNEEFNTYGASVSNLSDSIMTIFQDNNNNYWFGSNGQGVYKYDGKSLIQFTTTNGLISNEISGIQEDKVGNMYFDTQKGVSRFDGKIFNTLIASDTSANTWKMNPDDLWFKGNWNKNGVYRYDGKILHYLKFPESPRAKELIKQFPNMSWSPYGIYSIYEDKKGNIWFGTSNLGVYRFDGKNLSNLYEDQLTNTPSGGSFGIRSIFEDSDGKFWLSNSAYRYTIYPLVSNDTDKNTIKYKREKGIPNLKTEDGTNRMYFLSITEDNNNNLWTSTYEMGVWRYDGKNIKQYPVKAITTSITASSIYKDKKGDLWLVTHTLGVFKLKGEVFEKFQM